MVRKNIFSFMNKCAQLLVDLQLDCIASYRETSILFVQNNAKKLLQIIRLLSLSLSCLIFDFSFPHLHPFGRPLYYILSYKFV